MINFMSDLHTLSVLVFYLNHDLVQTLCVHLYLYVFVPLYMCTVLFCVGSCRTLTQNPARIIFSPTCPIMCAHMYLHKVYSHISCLCVICQVES